MATLNIGGKRVKVDDAFLSMTPEQQNATVEEIAASMGGGQQSGIMTLKGDMSGRKADFSERSTNVEDARPNPLASQLPGFLGDFENFSKAAQAGLAEGLTLGFADEIGAGIQAPFRAGADLLSGRGFDLGRAYGEGLDQSADTTRGMKELSPLTATGFEVGGAIMNPLTRLGLGGPTLPAQMLRGTATGAGVGGAYGFGSTDGDLEQRLQGAGVGALTGGAFGAAAPAIARGVGKVAGSFLQGRANKAAIKSAPTAAAIKAGSKAAFREMEAVDAAIKQPALDGLNQGMRQLMQREGIILPSGKVDPSFGRIASALDTVDEFATGRIVPGLNIRAETELGMKQAQTVWRALRRAAGSTDPGEARLGMKMMDLFEDWMDNLPLSAVTGDANRAFKAWAQGKSDWARFRKVQTLENAIGKAQRARGGFAAGLRSQFNRILDNPKRQRGFTEAELDAMKKFADRGTAEKLVDLATAFKSIPGAAAVFGLTSGNIPLALAAWGTGLGARGAINQGAKGMAKTIRAAAALPGGVPQLPGVTVPTLPNALALPLIDMMKPQPLPAR